MTYLDVITEAKNKQFMEALVGREFDEEKLKQACAEPEEYDLRPVVELLDHATGTLKELIQKLRDAHGMCRYCGDYYDPDDPQQVESKYCQRCLGDAQ